MSDVLERTVLWQDALGIPAAIEATLNDRTGIEEAAGFLRTARPGRIVASGNGASWYVALALWLASLGSEGPELLAVPAGLLGSRAWRWRDGDVLLAISSSGELNDLIAAQAALGPGRSVAITSNAGSSIGRAAAARAVVASEGQRSHTHTRSYCGSLAAGLAVVAAIGGDAALEGVLGSAARWVAEALRAAPAWLGDLPPGLGPSNAVVFGAGGAWPAALETALLLKEVAGVPAEGGEAREGATSATFGLSSTSLAVAVPTDSDAQTAGAIDACAATGARAVVLPQVRGAPAVLSPVTSFPYALALAAWIADARGLDVDRPAWAERYYSTVRSTAPGASA
jgi:glucosamine--fructose-6-phosphate aminotransferase (isomerizing)